MSLPAGTLTFSHFAGSAGGAGFRDAVGTAARFASPDGLAADAAGNLYVADSWENVIRKISPAGVVSTLAGGSLFSQDGFGPRAGFHGATGIAVDATGNVYVADRFAQAIRKITPKGLVTTVAEGAAASFSSPNSVAAAPDGTLYVADQGSHTIRKITPAGVVSTIAGLEGQSGWADGFDDEARFDYPAAIAIGPDGRLHVADTNNCTVRTLEELSGSVWRTTTYLGQPYDCGYGNGPAYNSEFTQPTGITVDPAGVIYVFDSERVRKITPHPTDDYLSIVETLAGTQRGYADGPGNVARFAYYSQGLAFVNGDLYVADGGNSAIRRVTADGTVSTFAGSTSAAGFANGSGSLARFNIPRGAILDGDGNLLVADTDNHILRKITPDGAVSTFAGSPGVAGSTEGAALSAALFNYPSAIAVDSTGNVYVADTLNHTIRKITSSGTVSTLAGATGQAGFVNATGPAARFNYPGNLTIDSAGNLYVTESGGDTIRKVTSGGTVSTYAGVPGVSQAVDGTASLARFNTVRGIVASNSGILHVLDAEYPDYLLRSVGLSGEVTTVAGQRGWPFADDGVGLDASFGYPSAIAIDASGALYVGDTNTIRRIATDYTVTTIAGSQRLVGSTDGSGPFARFRFISALAITDDGRIVVVDENTARIGVPSLTDEATIASSYGTVAQQTQLSTSPATPTANSWQWSIIRRPPGSVAALSSVTARSPTFTPDRPGGYTFELIASNGSVKSITSVMLDAAGRPPSITPAPITLSAGGRDQAMTLGTVSDPEDSAGSLIVDVLSTFDLYVSNVVNTNGTVTASVRAVCGADTNSDPDFLFFEVVNGSGVSGYSETGPTINPNTAPTLGSYPARTVNQGTTTSVTPAAPPADNGNLTLSATGSAGFTGSLSAHATTGVVTITNPNAGTFTITVTATDTCGLAITRSFPLTVSFGPPLNFTATASSATQVQLSWSSVAGADSYEVTQRSETGSTTIFCIANSYTDTSVIAERAYVYQVRALRSSGSPSPFSVPDAATTFVFTDPTLTASTTLIRAVHVQQLRSAVAALRRIAPLAVYSFTDPGVSGTPVRAAHVTELRSALSAARSALGLPSVVYSTSVTPGSAIHAMDFHEIRQGVR
jgi:sugar lactone lactonase YvrE